MVKEDNYLHKIADLCISKSKEYGSTDTSVLVKSSISENISFRNKKLDGSERSENLGVSLTTYIGKKKASISSTNLSENNFFIFTSPKKQIQRQKTGSSMGKLYLAASSPIHLLFV